MEGPEGLFNDHRMLESEGIFQIIFLGLIGKLVCHPWQFRGGGRPDDCCVLRIEERIKHHEANGEELVLVSPRSHLPFSNRQNRTNFDDWRHYWHFHNYSLFKIHHPRWRPDLQDGTLYPWHGEQHQLKGPRIPILTAGMHESQVNTHGFIRPLCEY